MFEEIGRDKKTAARIGIIKTMHGKIKSPLFLSVATRGCIKHLTANEMENLGFDAIIMNAFHLYLKPGINTISKFGGIHKFVNWKKVIFTDSGGFQMLSKEFFIKSSNKGVFFKSYDGKIHFMSPEKVIKIQEKIKSDVAMVLDDVPQFGKSKKEIENSMKKTHEWAERSIHAHRMKKQLLFGIAHGGIFSDLRKKSAEFIDTLDFDGAALGGLCLGEKKEVMYEAIKSSLSALSEKKPRYLMGVGTPKDILECISLGIDIFDSAYPTMAARHGTLLTRKGAIRIEKGIYSNDKKMIEDGCGCTLCSNHSRAFLNHLFRANEPSAQRLATVHNLFFMQRLVEDSIKAIENGTFLEFKKRFLRSF